MKRLKIIIFLLIPIVALSKDTTGVANPHPHDKQVISQQITDSTITPVKSEKKVLLETNATNDINIQIPIKEDDSNFFKDILPILTLLLGIGINRFLDFLWQRNKIKKTGERWIAELQCLTEPIKSQIKSLNDFLVEHKKDVFERPEIISYSILKGEIFKTLDKSELLKFLETKSSEYTTSVELSNEINGFVSVLSYSSDNIAVRFNKYVEDTSNYVTSFNKHLQLLIQSFGYYQTTLEKETGKDPIKTDDLYKKIIELYQQYIFPHSQDGAMELFSLQTNFFTPLIKELGEHRLNEKTKDMATHAANCMTAIKQIRMEKRYLEENISTIKKQFEKHSTSLIGLLNKLNLNKK